MFDAGEGEIRLTPFDVHVPMDIIKLFIMDETMKNLSLKVKFMFFKMGKA